MKRTRIPKHVHLYIKRTLQSLADLLHSYGYQKLGNVLRTVEWEIGVSA